MKGEVYMVDADRHKQQYWTEQMLVIYGEAFGVGFEFNYLTLGDGYRKWDTVFSFLKKKEQKKIFFFMNFCSLSLK